MAKRQPRTVLDLATSKLGVHRGALAAAHVAQWIIATDDLGHLPTTVEYSEFWCVSERTGWNHRANVHAVLGDDWPAAIERLVAAVDVADRSRSPRKMMRLSVA